MMWEVFDCETSAVAAPTKTSDARSAIDFKNGTMVNAEIAIGSIGILRFPSSMYTGLKKRRGAPKSLNYRTTQLCSPRHL